MGGMCLGSLGLSRVVSRQRHPLRVYAAARNRDRRFRHPDAGGDATRAVWVHGSGRARRQRAEISRLGLQRDVFLPPTVMMGATLPAVSRWVEMSPRGVSWAKETFYGGNTLGAVFGCLLAGFYLLRAHDMHTATFVAVVLNATVAAGALALRARPSRGCPARPKP